MQIKAHWEAEGYTQPIILHSMIHKETMHFLFKNVQDTKEQYSILRLITFEQQNLINIASLPDSLNSSQVWVQEHIFRDFDSVK